MHTMISIHLQDPGEITAISGTDYAIVRFGDVMPRADVFLRTPAEADALIAAAVQAKKLLTGEPELPPRPADLDVHWKGVAEEAGVPPKFCMTHDGYYWHCWDRCPVCADEDDAEVIAVPIEELSDPARAHVMSSSPGRDEPDDPGLCNWPLGADGKCQRDAGHSGDCDPQQAPANANWCVPCGVPTAADGSHVTPKGTKIPASAS